MAGDALDQLVVGDGVAIAEHHRRYLGVEDRVRNDTGAMPDDFDVLTGGVEYLQHLLVGHQREERLEIDAVGQRIDDDRFLRARHLHHAKQRIIGRLAQEFGVDGNDRVFGETAANGGEFRIGSDQIHERSMTLRKRRSAERADMSRVLRRIRALHLRRRRVFTVKLFAGVGADRFVECQRAFQHRGFILRDGAEFIIGPRFARTRWRLPGMRSC